MRQILAFSILLCVASPASASLVAYWDFTGYDGNATTIAPTTGTGSLSMSAGLVSTDVSAGTGTIMNELSVSAPNLSLDIINSIPVNNGEFILLSFSTLGLQDIVLTYATSKSNGNSFISNQWAYSTDGVSFTNWDVVVNPANSNYGLVTRDFSSVAALDNDATVFLRYTLGGADTNVNQASRYNSLDNIQLNAGAITPSAIPEPSGIALLGIGCVAAFGFFRRRRNEN